MGHSNDGSSCDRFQDAVSSYLIRHKSILDVTSKLQESNARVNRAIAKAVTSCGCISVSASKPDIPTDISFWELKEYMGTHVSGELCESCRDVIEVELGRSLFYLAALCETLGFDMDQVVENEKKRISTLGVFNLT